MSFQSTVNRQYTQGFPGEIIADGPLRLKPGRIDSATIGVDAGLSTNRISRAFGYSSDLPTTGSTNSASGALVVVGGAKFYGVLAHPKHYALYGNAGDSLGASMDLPKGANAEFAEMAIMVLELFNETTGSKTVNYGDGIAYVPVGISGANNTLALPLGALVSYPAGGSVPTGMVAIPNARVTNPITMTASALGALVSGYTKGQLTQ